MPFSGGRLLEAGVERFLQHRDEILGKSALLLLCCGRITYQRPVVPLVIVLTKSDLLDTQLELDLSPDENLEQHKSSYLDKHCIQPLHKAAGNNVTHVTVSGMSDGVADSRSTDSDGTLVQDGYSECLTNLVKATLENMDEYHDDEAPRVVASIAQRVSIKEKIELSIAYVPLVSVYAHFFRHVLS